MAIFPTKLLDAIVFAGEQYKLQSFEGRLSDYSVYQAFRDNTSMLIPAAELESAKKSSTRVTKIPVLNKIDFTIGDTRACTPGDQASTSAFVQPSYSTYVFDFFMTPSYNEDNYITYQQEFSHKLLQGLKKFGETIDVDAVTFLEANLTQVNSSPLFGGIVGDTVGLSWAEREEFYKSIPSIMVRNDLSGNRVLDIANPEAQIMYDSIARQGAGNAVNTAYQISNFAPYRSNRVALDAGIAETHYLIPQGHIGTLSWIPMDFKIGKGEGDNLWTSVVDPVFGLTWALRYVYACSDLSAVSGGDPALTSAFVEKFEFSIDIAFMTSYSSDTSSAIFKYEIAEDVVLT
jgi:hypothetical protein